MKNIAQAFQLALKNIRSRLFHTFLSVLGIIIGVAALVSILSLIDGLEKYAKEQVEGTTSLNMVFVSVPEGELVNDVMIKKENVEFFDYQMIQEMVSEIDNIPRYVYDVSWNSPLEIEGKTIAAKVAGISRFIADQEENGESEEPLFGQEISATQIESKEKVAVVNESFASVVEIEGEELLGKEIKLGGETYLVQGVAKDEEDAPPTVQIPPSLVSKEEMNGKRAVFYAKAEDVTELRDLKEKMESWFSENQPQLAEDVKVEINEFRMDQLEKGFLVFRLIMGLIVGISVVVGGVGIMNVMLISLKERTPEIGVLKAIGAKRKDILSQFLAESVFISLLGSFVGILIGIGFTAAAVPLVNSIVKQTGGEGLFLRAAYTLNTMLVIGVIAVIIGILFGTYPAIRASKLRPVDAIRRV